MKLDSGTLRILRLTERGAAADGWAKVSQQVWPLVATLPDDLVEKRPSEDGGHIRLTEGGKLIVHYS